MLPHVQRFASMWIDRIRIEGRYYGRRQLAAIVQRYGEFLRGGPLTAEEEKRCQIAEGKDFTRGHYFRGVL